MIFLVAWWDTMIWCGHCAPPSEAIYFASQHLFPMPLYASAARGWPSPTAACLRQAGEDERERLRVNSGFAGGISRGDAATAASPGTSSHEYAFSNSRRPVAIARWGLKRPPPAHIARKCLGIDATLFIAFHCFSFSVRPAFDERLIRGRQASCYLPDYSRD